MGTRADMSALTLLASFLYVGGHFLRGGSPAARGSGVHLAGGGVHIEPWYTVSPADQVPGDRSRVLQYDHVVLDSLAFLA